MIPGPVPVSQSVLSKLGSEVKAHTDPEFIAEFQQLLAELRSIMNCDGIAFLVAGSGTMAMEMAIANIANEKEGTRLFKRAFRRPLHFYMQKQRT